MIPLKKKKKGQPVTSNELKGRCKEKLSGMTNIGSYVSITYVNTKLYDSLPHSSFSQQ
jgi:hypothetical protein